MITKKRKAKAQFLAFAMSGPQVQKLLGVSHVAVLKLYKRGVLGERLSSPAGKAALYDAAAVRRFARGYKPQRNPAKGAGQKNGRPKKRKQQKTGAPAPGVEVAQLRTVNGRVRVIKGGGLEKIKARAARGK